VKDTNKKETEWKGLFVATWRYCLVISLEQVEGTRKLRDCVLVYLSRCWTANCWMSGIVFRRVRMVGLQH